MYQLRIYTLASKEAAEIYSTFHWKKHVESLKKYGIVTHHVFTDATDSDKPRVYALVSYDGKDMDSQDKKYMESVEFKEDMKGFDFRNILKVESIKMTEVKM